MANSAINLASPLYILNLSGNIRALFSSDLKACSLPGYLHI